MEIGVSCACFYPLETEKALERIGEMGFRIAEVFVNSFCEMEPPLLNEIVSVKSYYDLRITSIHPYTSFAESFVFFSNYKRRFHDGLEFYKAYFDFANALGAKILVIHGAGLQYSVGNEEYFERFGQLAQLGRERGIIVAQENVVRHRSQSPEFLIRMNDYLGDLFSMVLDIKQCVRSGVSPLEFVDALGNKIKHIHFSDHNSEKDCLPPGRGDFDYSALFSAMKAKGVSCDGVIELYSSDFETDSELINSAEVLKKRLKNL